MSPRAGALPQIREMVRQSTFGQQRDQDGSQSLSAMAVGVSMSVVAAVPFARSPASSVVAPSAIVAIPSRSAPCCAVIRRMSPPAGVPDITSLYRSPVARHPDISGLWHGRSNFISNGRRRCSDHDGDLAECGCRKGGRSKQRRQQPLRFHRAPSCLVSGAGMDAICLPRRV
jgi:hypothetical protein